MDSINFKLIQFFRLEFDLLENGRVDWRNASTPTKNNSSDEKSSVPANPLTDTTLPDNPSTERALPDNPLTQCSAYEVIVGKKAAGRGDSGSSGSHRLRFAAVEGQVVSFEVENQSHLTLKSNFIKFKVDRYRLGHFKSV